MAAIEDVLILGLGMSTSVGLSTPEAAAAVRAGTARFTEIDWRDRSIAPFTVAEVPEAGLVELSAVVAAEPGLTARETRLLRLASSALGECLSAIAGKLRPPLVLALPEIETTRALDGPRFLRLLEQQTDGAFDINRSRASDRGPAGGLTAIGEAHRRISHGEASLVVAGGADSFLDLYVLATLDLQGRVKSRTNLDGFIPGEGAGFVLLGNTRTAVSSGLSALGRLSPTVEAFEDGHLGSEKPYRGDGLAAAFSGLFQNQRVPAPVAEVYSSMNGESHWVKEWGVSYTRNKPSFAASVTLHHPADRWGDVGTAAGPLMVGLAAMGIRGGYRGSCCLVYCSSDLGGRSVLVVSAHQG